MVTRSIPFLLLLIVPCFGGDQIGYVPFRTIFPFVKDAKVEKLITSINRQTTLNDSIAVLNDWINANWVTPTFSTTPKPSKTQTTTPSKYYYGRLVEKEFCRNLAIGFVKQRDAVRKFAKYLFVTTQILDYFNKTTAIQMRHKFWSVDKNCLNDFECVERNFYLEMRDMEHLDQKKHRNVTNDLKLLGSVAYEFPLIRENLKWTFHKE